MARVCPAPQLAALGHRQLARRGAGAGHVGGAARPQAHALPPRLEPPLLAEEQHGRAARRRRRRALPHAPHRDRQLGVMRQVPVLRGAAQTYRGPTASVSWWNADGSARVLRQSVLTCCDTGNTSATISLPWVCQAIIG